MPLHSKGDNELVMVRRRQTGDIEIRRADEFSRVRPFFAIEDRTLHYVGSDRTRVCRCSSPERHFVRTFNVASESTHLNANLTLYMNRHCLESCTIAAFRTYRRRREAQWAKDAVFIDEFHYANFDKTLLCRCLRPSSHEYGRPRNLEIVEQCAEFFCLYKEAMKVSREQWRRIDGDSPPSYTPEPQVEYSRSTKPRFESSPYCRMPSHEPMNSEEQSRRRSEPEMRIRSIAERMAPGISRHRCKDSAMQQGPEMPPKVWHDGRPSLWKVPDSTFSGVSTPLGSTFSPPTGAPNAAGKIPLKHRSISMDSAHRASTSTYWTQIQRDAGVGEEDLGPEPLYPVGARLDTAFCMRPILLGVQNVPIVYKPYDDEPSPALSELASREYVAELPAATYVPELSSDTPRYRHIPTLKNLEGRDWDTVSELEAKSAFGTAHVEELPNCTSRNTRSAARLSSLFEQVMNIAELSVPNQDEYLHRVEFFSRGHSAFDGACQICKKSYRGENMRALVLPGCSHSMHESCFLCRLQTVDHQFGKCPICQEILCRRSLADRIGTDREAIFGSRFTPLPNEICIEFPQRSEVVKCRSEEEVAVVQLRLLKDYVDVHAEEVFHQWEANRAEPDWYAGVVRPVVRLYQGWNTTSHSQYFADAEAFLKLVAWAELERLMNVSRVETRRAPNVDAMFPQLAGLHQKFLWAIERYEKEKVTWETNVSGIVWCDKIASNTIRVAMSSHTP
ncbi:hypothetical protein DDE82_008617 [Stemphylium lycopersici]|nr:hypothetical protein DDE82_008617 [Stemphylium lycopersici]